MKFRCCHCNNTLPISQVKNCSNCGALLCQSCASSLGGRCPKCDADLDE